eukprot:g68579.t1
MVMTASGQMPRGAIPYEAGVMTGKEFETLQEAYDALRGDGTAIRLHREDTVEMFFGVILGEEKMIGVDMRPQMPA